MTIHTKWMELLRKEASSAFQYGELTLAAKASFIDGQIKLMKSESVQTWADFIGAKFTSTIMRHFLVYGCTTVVLAFDDKRYVPKAKSITQRKRREVNFFLTNSSIFFSPKNHLHFFIFFSHFNF